jgi:DNA-binding response OmpR family regulator
MNCYAIPLVFLTALRCDRGSRIKALEPGAEAFLYKQLDELELLAEVRAMAKLKAATVRPRL